MIGDYVGTIALALLYLLAMLGWGSLVFKFFPRAERTFWDTLVSQIIAGTGVLYSLYIVLGTLGRLRTLEVSLMLGAGLLAACFSIATRLNLTVANTESERWDNNDRILVILVIALAALQMIFGLTPLIFYDLQVYHLLAPSQFLSSGSFIHIPWNVQTNSPLALQLTLGMSLALDSSGQLAKLLFAIFGCLLCLGAFELIRPAGRKAGLIAALLVLSFPEFWMMQTLGVVDLPIAGLMIFGTIWAKRAVKGRMWHPAILAGIAFGIAIGSRYQALILTTWILAALLAEKFITERKLPDPRLILQLTVIGLLVALLICPWLVRNYVHTGNPAYPLLQSVWGGNEWSTEQAARLNAEALGPRLQTLSTTQKVLAPIMALLVFPSNGLFGTGLLLAALIAVFMPNRDLRIVALLGLGGLVIWGLIRPAAGVPLLRYNALSLVFLLSATGGLLGSEVLPGRSGFKIAGVLTVGSFIVAMVHVHSIIPAAQSLTDRTVRQALHQLSVPSWAAFDYVNDKLDPSRDKVLLIGETRGFWLQVPYVAPSSFNGPQLDGIFGKLSTSNEWVETLGAMGITHLLISNPELTRLHKQYGYLQLTPERMEAFDRWLQNLPHAFEDGHGTTVLTLTRSVNDHVRSN